MKLNGERDLKIPVLKRGVRVLCKPDMVYVLDRGHGLHFYSLSFPCQPLAGVILLVR